MLATWRSLGFGRSVMQFDRGGYSIGEIAVRTGLTPDALRYYERVGLLPQFRRTSGGFRIYSSGVVERVRFIRQAKTIGLSLQAIRRLVRCVDSDCAERQANAIDAVTTTLAQVDAKLTELREFQSMLKGCLDRVSASLLQHDESSETAEGAYEKSAWRGRT
jgi:DNA-binding transcriptional MerR regulator